MKIEVFNVEHGQCAAIYCPPNNTILMVDAGYNSTLEWRPSKQFAGKTIEMLVVSNYDEDHTNDVPLLMKKCTLRTIARNRTISAANLAAMKKEHGMGPGVSRLHEWLKGLETSSSGGITPDTGDVEYVKYYNSYGTFDDANNLSVATFIKYNGFKMLFPGDLEEDGWEELWKRKSFRDEWEGTNILLASHHGRENGCFDEMFELHEPQAVIISDSGPEHSTQDTRDWYYNRTVGVKTRAGKERSVFTTNNDGHIYLDILPNGSYYITTESEQNAASSLTSLAKKMYPTMS